MKHGLTMYLKMTCNSVCRAGCPVWISQNSTCLCLLCAGIKGACHRAKILYMFLILILSLIYNWERFLQSTVSYFTLVIVFFDVEAFEFNVILCVNSCAIRVCYQKFLLMFVLSSSSAKVSFLTLRSLVHFELIFGKGSRVSLFLLLFVFFF